MAGEKDLTSLVGLLGGAVQSAGSIATSAEAASTARDATKQRTDLFNQYRKMMSPDVISQGIERLAGNLSEAEKSQIIRDITARMSSSGAQGATGILQQAIAEALIKARLPMLDSAKSAYFAGAQMPASALSTSVPPPASIGNPFKFLQDYFANKKPVATVPQTTLKPGDTAPSAGPDASVGSGPFDPGTA